MCSEPAVRHAEVVTPSKSTSTSARRAAPSPPSTAPSPRSRWFWAAAAAGGLHAAVSLYWLLGGSLLIETVGSTMLEMFVERRWMLAPVVLVKALAAFVPLVMDAWRPSLRRAAPLACWAGVAVLVGWGGLGMIVANLVLFGVIVPEGGIDRSAMIGHAWLWDPLFVVWGACLAVGLWRTRRDAVGGRA